MAALLLPYDGSPASRRAVDLLAAYAGDPARLAPAVLHVLPPPLPIADGERAIRPVLRRLRKAGIGAEGRVRIGSPAEEILREARDRRAELILMGTRGRGAVRGFAVGSVAMRVAHGGAAPVLLTKPKDRLPAGFGRRLRVLLAADGSEPSQRAAERLAAWRAWLGELEMHLAHVEQWSRPGTDEGERATRAARELFRRAGIAHHLHLTVGEPALELSALARDTGADLVALGTRGLGAAHHALVGSTALKTAALSTVPVLLVP